MTADLNRLHEIYPPAATVLMPLGLRVNDMVFAGSLSGADLITGEFTGDVKQQTATALQRMRDLVERAGGSLDNVARAVGFCTRAEDRPLVDEVWMSVFPDPQDKPAFKVLLAELPERQLARIEALALLGARRRRIDIPNVAAHDPTIKIGNWVFSSRCHGNDPATGQIVEGGLAAEARQTLENLAALVRLAGGSEANIVQIATFGRDASYLPTARRVIEERFPDPTARPAVNQMVNFIVPHMQVAMEMVAVL